MSRRQQYEDKVRQKLQELEQEIEQLSEHLKAVEAELLPQHEEHFHALRELQARARDKLEELLASSDEVFESMQDHIEEYWASLGREIKAFDLKLQDS